MKGLIYLLVILQINLVFPQYFDNLGQHIRQQVQESLRGTENLGQIISRNIKHQLSSVNNLPISISQNVRQRMVPVRNLGDEINQAVNHELQPVYAMSLKDNMKNGVGGRTIVTYGSGKQLIVESGQRYTCNGNIQRGRCDGLILPFRIVNEQDYCYTSSYAVVNDNVCLSSGGGLNTEIYNGKLSCHSSTGLPVIILTNQEYQDLCRQALPLKANYEYYANPNSPNHVPIPNRNPYVTCLNNEPNVCIFEDSPSGSETVISSNQNDNSFSSSFSFSN